MGKYMSWEQAVAKGRREKQDAEDDFDRLSLPEKFAFAKDLFCFSKTKQADFTKDEQKALDKLSRKSFVTAVVGRG